MFHKQFDSNLDLIDSVINSRYGRNAQYVLEDYIYRNGFSKFFVSRLLKRLEYFINTPFEYAKYTIPIEVNKNRDILLNALTQEILEIKNINSLELAQEKIVELFVDKNWLIKYCTRKWLLLNSGLALELTILNDKYSFKYLELLKKEYGVVIGNSVVHRHVISNKERLALKQYGITTPFEHWDRAYYEDAMRKIRQIVKSNPECVGIVSEGSWVYNPKLYEIADDGKPYATFTFLREDKLVGHRFFDHKASKVDPQFDFATRNERRKAYVENGKLDIDVYSIFYPASELLSQTFN